MTASTRAPSERERENNKRRERRRRAVQSRMFTCLRRDDDLNLPKHCDNNEVLKALCRRAGYIVEEDGTTFKPRYQRRDGVCEGMQSAVDCWQPRSSVHFDSSAPSSDASANGNVNALQWLGSATARSSTALPSIPRPVRGGSFSAPVTPPLSSPRRHAFSRPPDSLPDFVMSKSDFGQSNLSQSSPPSRGDSPLSNVEGVTADPSFDSCAANADNGSTHPNILKTKYPDLASHRSDVADLMPPRAPLEFASFAPDSTADFTVFKNCNPFFASCSSTPTYATSRLVSGTSTPSCFYTSGTCTPAQSSLYSSGACTPTSHSNGMRALPIHFAVAISNLALTQSQDDLQDEERAASDAPAQRKEPSGFSIPPLPTRPGMVVLESTSKGMPGLKSNVYGDVCDPPPMQALSEVLSDGRGTKMDALKKHGVVKPWEGETIHEVSLGEEELELTLGSAAWEK